LRKKISAAKRLARRPGRKRSRETKAIRQCSQPFNPHIPELNPKFRESPHPRGGAPLGNKNRLTHGGYTQERQALWADVRALVKEGRTLVREVRELFAVTKSGPGASYPQARTIERIER